MQHTLPLGERSAHTAEKERQSGDTDYECMGISTFEWDQQ